VLAVEEQRSRPGSPVLAIGGGLVLALVLWWVVGIVIGTIVFMVRLIVIGAVIAGALWLWGKFSRDE
jgi:hypothetical protein